MKYFKSWEDACRESPMNKAVGDIMYNHKDGSMRNGQIVKPMYGQPILCYDNTLVKIRNATTREVDSVYQWMPY
jgi:hypothetical protein